MAVSATYPGVYIEEVPSGVRTILGVSTSTRAFVDFARRMPRAAPAATFSFAEARERPRVVARAFPDGGEAWILAPHGRDRARLTVVLASRGARSRAVREVHATVMRPAHAIDLSRVVSKYIGEAEKNLRRVFDAAETSGVVLFFDEGEALFGRRTSVKDAHDRYASQELDDRRALVRCAKRPLVRSLACELMVRRPPARKARRG